MRTDTPQTIRLKDYCPPAYLIDKVDLDIALDPSRTRVRSKLKIRRNPASTENGGPLRLNGENLELATILLDKAELQSKDYEITETELVIRKPPEKPFTLEITTFVNPEANKALQGLYRSRRRSTARSARPRASAASPISSTGPDVLATYTVRIEADPNEAPVLLSNGNPVERGTRDGRQAPLRGVARPAPQALLPVRARRRRSRRRSPPRSRTMSGRKVDLRIYVEPGKEARAPGRWIRSSARCAGTRSASAASTISTCSTSSPCPTSTWGRWRTRASTSSTTG